MKKFLVCVTTIVCLFPVINGFAQENSNDAFFKAEALIQEGLFENTEELKELSADLSVAETEQLYSINKKDKSPLNGRESKLNTEVRMPKNKLIFTEEQISSVSFKALGIERISNSSERVIPFETTAE